MIVLEMEVCVGQPPDPCQITCRALSGRSVHIVKNNLIEIPGNPTDEPLPKTWILYMGDAQMETPESNQAHLEFQAHSQINAVEFIARCPEVSNSASKSRYARDKTNTLCLLSYCCVFGLESEMVLALHSSLT